MILILVSGFSKATVNSKPPNRSPCGVQVMLLNMKFLVHNFGVFAFLGAIWCIQAAVMTRRSVLSVTMGPIPLFSYFKRGEGCTIEPLYNSIHHGKSREVTES